MSTLTPEDGKANKQIIRLLAKELGLPKSTITMIRGHTSRDKTRLIEKPNQNLPLIGRFLVFY